MGTRNLTMVISNGKTKVAQYAQWDGYPEGQGKTVLEFLRKADLPKFKELIEKVKFLTDKQIKARYKACGIEGEWMNMEESERFKKANPQLNRDMGAEVLDAIYNEQTSELQDSSTFAGDSLFCEWAYVIDLDKNVLEVYTGFNTDKLKAKDRFFYLQEGVKERDDKYYPVRLLKSFPLSKLPTPTQFIKQCTKKEEA